MLDTLRSLFSELAGAPAAPRRRFEENDYRVAAAALMVHVTGIDGAVSEAERQRLHEMLRYRFGLDDEGTDALIAEATSIEGEAVDLYGFTSLLNRALDADGRARIVEMMWEMIYADGRVNEFEDNVVWRVADLLHVSSRERLALRSQVAGGQADPNKAD